MTATPSRRTRFRLVATLGALAIAPFAMAFWPGSLQTSAKLVPPPQLDETAATAPSSETAVLAGGCFWGVQGVFQHVKGVSRATSGYAGGTEASARYGTVSTGSTGHAESVQITFDPREITYGRILQIFFSVAHDPTERDRQGPDTGPQYRSAIFPANDEQTRIARSYIAELDRSGAFKAPLATTIEPQKPFYPAEAYHQDYLTLHPNNPYIAINDIPKVEDLKRLFGERYRDTPVTVARNSVGG